MSKLLGAVAVLGALLVSGCAGTSATVKSDFRLAPSEKVQLQLVTPSTVTDEGAAILRERLTAQLASHGLLAAGAAGSTRTVVVEVTNYYMRHGAARALVGIMAGVDNVQSVVKVKDPGGQVVSEFKVESTNPTAWGTSRGMLQDHADKVVETLRGAAR